MSIIWDYQLMTITCKMYRNSKNALDRQHYIGALFMDLPKALDYLPHSLSIAKFHNWLELHIF